MKLNLRALGLPFSRLSFKYSMRKKDKSKWDNFCNFIDCLVHEFPKYSLSPLYKIKDLDFTDCEAARDAVFLLSLAL